MRKKRIYGKRIAVMLCAGLLAVASVPVRAEVSGEVKTSGNAEVPAEVQTAGQMLLSQETPEPGEVQPPQIQITREKISGAIEGGKNFETNLIIDNSSQDYPLKDVKLTLEGSSELVLREPTNTISLGTIKANEQRDCRVRL